MNYENYKNLGNVHTLSHYNYGAVDKQQEINYSLYDSKNNTYQILNNQRGVIVNTSKKINGINIPSIPDLLG